MKKPGKNLQQRSLSLLQVLMILGVTFVATTVVLQLQVEYNLLILIYALSAVAVLLYWKIRNRMDRDKMTQEEARGAALPGRPGAGRPGPELRGGAAHHGPRGDLDPAAHQPPAGQ